MGLAASQARLLLLTARKSDLEYRAQQITNSLMILAQQTEQVAREYSIKISNQTIMYMDSTSRDQTSQKVSAALVSTLGIGGAYKLKIRRTDSDTWDNWTPQHPLVHSGNWINENGDVLDSSEYQALSPEEKAKCTQEMIENTNIILNDYSGPEILEGYNNGTMKIVDADGKDVDLNSNNGFVTTYYTDDDRAAEAEYNTKTASIQVKEKRLQNDLNQVQTQQKACETEMDSVKKVLDKNIERTFKVFS